MIKSFRKSKRLSNSLSSSKHSISRVTSTHINGSDMSEALKSPLKVIKALYDYEPQGPGELKFSKGDFFHVLDTESEHEANGWYEATNPATNKRGMVPLSYFEVFNRTKPGSSTEEHVIDQGNPFSAKLNQAINQQKSQNQSLYAVTLFEFKAERPDELDVVPGENLVICAHHEHEWFIAKPITRLGGPGLVPVLYVKIIDVTGNGNAEKFENDTVGLINHFQIPTIEEWKDQTAKYQALSIPLGQVPNGNTALSSTSQFFQKDSPHSPRSSLSSNKIFIVEAAVESYHLEHGRYQYSVVARLSNGQTRYLYRFYQDFYDLQVKLLELFPYEAGKLENSRRIIPSIPGPLINVNDSISKLRREKLDYYLRNLIALPTNISRSEEVLGLFEVQENGYDREVFDNREIDRSSKPVMQKSNYQQDRLSQYSNHQPNVQRSLLTPSLESPIRSRSSSSANLIGNPPYPVSSEKLTKLKAKFYYEDDIFVLLLPVTLRLVDLKTKLTKRLNLDPGSSIHLFLKSDFEEFMDLHNVTSDSLSPVQRDGLFQMVIDGDSKFQAVLCDKCKIVILTE